MHPASSAAPRRARALEFTLHTAEQARPASSAAPRRARAGLLLLGLALAACGGEPAGPPRTFGGDRPVTLQAPAQLDDGRAYPLILVLHAYGASGLLQQAYFGVGELAMDGNPVGTALVLAPDGTLDTSGRRFWNADPLCCDFDHLGPDDVGYLGGLVEEVMAEWPVDRDQVYVLGHSNGGVMAYRLACERADLFAGILSLAGAAVTLPCAPSRPVSIVHLQGTADELVPFSVATSSVTQWAGLDGCEGSFMTDVSIDLEVNLAGAETRTDLATGCPLRVAVELWTIQGAGHVPSLGNTFLPNVWRWISHHQR